MNESRRIAAALRLRANAITKVADEQYPHGITGESPPELLCVMLLGMADEFIKLADELDADPSAV